MIKIIGGVLSCFFISFICTSAVQAASSYYGGFFALQQYDRPDLENPVVTQVVYGRMGSHLSEWAAFEGRLGFGVSDEKTKIKDRDNQVRADNVVGLYLKLYPHWIGALGAYGLLGYSRVTTTETRLEWFPRATISSSLTLGVGFDWFLLDKLALNGELCLLANDDDASINALQIGLTQYF